MRSVLPCVAAIFSSALGACSPERPATEREVVSAIDCRAEPSAASAGVDGDASCSDGLA